MSRGLGNRGPPPCRGRHLFLEFFLRLPYLLNNIIPKEFAQNHRECLYHIHDLEFYDLTYNCIGISIDNIIFEERVDESKDYCQIDFYHMLRKLSRGIIDLTNRQSGGIGIINFDFDAAKYITDETDEEIYDALHEFLIDLNLSTRKGCEKPYVTLNFGLDTSKNGRRVSINLLNAFKTGFKSDYSRNKSQNNLPFIFPNLVFKVKKDINLYDYSPNYDIYINALSVTAKRMIPTYLNCDSFLNHDLNSRDLGIMGCRTRLGKNINSRDGYLKDGAMNRGNIAAITINLVRIAYKTKKLFDQINKIVSLDKNIALDYFKKILGETMDSAKRLLLHRYNYLKENVDLSYVFSKKYYSALNDGSLSIGFIGLWDAISLLNDTLFLNKKDFEKSYADAYTIIEYMNNIISVYSEETKLNFSLLASSAEGVTGRFASYDQENLYDVSENSFLCNFHGFYTNSFHVPVDVKINYRDKIDLEGPFHKLCTGGSITYVEFKEMPNKNIEAVQEVVEYALEKDCNYVGINFPLDSCLECNFTGRIGNICPNCSSKNIRRLRRVSGYLSDIDSFTVGKRKELENRTNHCV